MRDARVIRFPENLQNSTYATEREFDAADIAELQAELDEADEAAANYDADEEADMMWATREWNYR